MSTVFTITRPTAKKTTRAVSGTEFFLKSGESVKVPLANVVPQLVADVDSGEFTSVPALPRDAADDNPSLAKVIQWVNAHNTKFVLNANVAGGAGEIKLSGYVEVQDASSVPNTLADGLRVKVRRQSGTGTIDGDTLTEKVLTLADGKAEFTVEIPAAAIDTTVIELVDEDATGLDVSDTANFDFTT